MNALTHIIRQELDQTGTIPFARFMELALYHPEHGYYERTAPSVGRRGDFYTSVSVGNLFGELLAFQFVEWIQESRKLRISQRAGPVPPPPPPGQIVEAGAHDGRLAADLLGHLRNCRPELLEDLEYWIIEPSPRRQSWQRQTLRKFSRQVRWFDSWEALPESGVRGVIFANELLDAFPVHRLGWDAKKQEWFEWGVGREGENFVWARMPRAREFKFRLPLFDTGNPECALDLAHGRELLAVLPDGFTTEVCPAAEAWWRNAAMALKQGRLLTLDYGRRAEDFFRPDHAHGTLRAYHQHRVSDDLLARPGEQDLTAHVNFTALQTAGENAGLKTLALLTQEKFLTHIAEAAWQTAAKFAAWTPARVRQFQTLTHLEHLGRSFQVLLQARE